MGVSYHARVAISHGCTECRQLTPHARQQEAPNQGASPRGEAEAVASFSCRINLCVCLISFDHLLEVAFIIYILEFCTHSLAHTVTHSLAHSLTCTVKWDVSECLVESDGGDVIGALMYGFHATATIEGAAVMSLEAGMDVDLGGTTFPKLVDAVKANVTTEAQVGHVDLLIYSLWFPLF